MADTLVAGREADALVAEKVMGWMWTHTTHGKRILIPPHGHPAHTNNWGTHWDEHGRPHWLPAYSKDIAAAWQVVERIIDIDGPFGKHEWAFDLEYVRNDWMGGFNGWIASFKPLVYHPEELRPPVHQHAATAPLAICLAALKVVEEDERELPRIGG